MGIKPKILCVDDLAVNLRIRCLMLEKFGCDTVSASDRRSALRALEGGDVDLMVIDYHLAQGETGEEVAREARAMQPGLPLIMLTGDAKIPDSAQDSVDEVLVKGQCGPTALLDTIQKLLPGFNLHPPQIAPQIMLNRAPRRNAS